MRIMPWIVSMSTRSPGFPAEFAEPEAFVDPAGAVHPAGRHQQRHRDDGVQTTQRRQHGHRSGEAVGAGAQGVGYERADEPFLHVAGARREPADGRHRFIIAAWWRFTKVAILRAMSSVTDGSGWSTWTAQPHATYRHVSCLGAVTCRCQRLLPRWGAGGGAGRSVTARCWGR